MVINTESRFIELDTEETPLYHQQQNKWYPQRCLLAHFEAILDFSRTEFTCP